MRALHAVLAVLLLGACRATAPSVAGAPDNLGARTRLPTGRALDPAGISHPLGSLPLTILRAPDSGYVVVLSGFNEQGIQLLNHDGTVRQTLPQAAAFLGAVFAPDGRTLYVSGGNQDVVYRYAWAAGLARLTDSLPLAPKARDLRNDHEFRSLEALVDCTPLLAFPSIKTACCHRLGALSVRWMHPAQQHGRFLPSSNSSRVRLMRRWRVAGCFASSTQQINSFRPSGVRFCHSAEIFGSDRTAA